MEASSWHLDDAEELHREAPDSFFIPPEADRHGLQPGDLVKLVFRFRPQRTGGHDGERMWVEVVEEVEAGRYVGKLADEPREAPGLQYGDTVQFEARHVAAKEYSEDQLGYDSAMLAAVNKRVLLGEAPGRVIYVAEMPGVVRLRRRRGRRGAAQRQQLRVVFAQAAHRPLPGDG